MYERFTNFLMCAHSFERLWMWHLDGLWMYESVYVMLFQAKSIPHDVTKWVFSYSFKGNNIANLSHLMLL